MPLKWNEREWRELTRAQSGPTGQLMVTAGQLGVAAAKRYAPVSRDGSHGRPSGYMRSKIRYELGEDGEGLYVDVIAGADYSLFVEVGTGPHRIESKGDWPLQDKRGNVFGRAVEHPGTPAQPFLRPSLDDVRRQL